MSHSTCFHLHLVPASIMPIKNQNVPGKICLKIKMCQARYVSSTWNSKTWTHLFCLSPQYVWKFRVWRCTSNVWLIMILIKLHPLTSYCGPCSGSDLNLPCLSNCSCTISRAVTEKSDISTVPRGRTESPFGIDCPRTNKPLSRGVLGIKSWRNDEDRNQR